ncbi:MAG: accessory gene regulator B family protein [Oscillospiraceae bacterium]|nr:accessory gene regulator B family protein [Oscillospiraceae bacterium]
MFDKMSAFITDTLIEGKIIKMEERNLYLYCFGILIEMMANLITTLIIGALLGKIVTALFFMLVFIPLRSTAGGYHCETAGKCYLLSMAVYLAVILTYDGVSIAPSYVCALICAIDFAAIIILSPVASPNKPITANEKTRNRWISIALSLIYIIVILVMLNCKIVYAFVILESLTVAVVSMIAGHIKYKKAS